MLQSDSLAREYVERALALWVATDGRNLTDHATLQITSGQHQEVRHEWIGQALETHYALELQAKRDGPLAACWAEITEVSKVLKVIVNAEGTVITTHFDRRETRRLLRDRRETPP